jgi:transposase-like protein
LIATAWCGSVTSEAVAGAAVLRDGRACRIGIEACATGHYLAVGIEHLLEEELEAALGRGRYERGPGSKGHRNGHRDRRLDTTFGPLVLAVPRARLADDDAGEREWKSELLPAYRRLSRRAELLIAQVYLAGVNTRRVRRALATLFAGHIGKDTVSRAWAKTRAAWEAWQCRDLAEEDIVRLILDGTVVKVRLDRKATAISLLIALGIRHDGQKVVLAMLRSPCTMRSRRTSTI